MVQPVQPFAQSPRNDPLIVKIAFGLIAAVVVIVGVTVCALAIQGIVDPGSVQASNDAAPFGEPPSQLRLAWSLAVGAAVVTCGALLFRNAAMRRRPSHE